MFRGVLPPVPSVYLRMNDSTSSPQPSRVDRFALGLSLALVPPTITTTTFAVLVLTWQHGSPLHRVLIWVTASLFSGLLQMAQVLYARKNKQVTAYDVPERQHRTRPYLYSIALGAIGTLALLYLDASLWVWGLMVCFTINTAVVTLINLKWKISAHLLGLTGPLPFLVPVIGPWVLFALPVVVALAWARVHLKSHSVAQVVVGALLGYLLTLGELTLLTRTGGGVLTTLW